MKEIIKQIPIIGAVARRISGHWSGRRDVTEPFAGSADYWERRYSAGGNSGAGSYAMFAEFKAEVLNAFVEDRQIMTVIEFGCGDGNQLRLARYPEYTGFDVSNTAIWQCRRLFKSDRYKSFRLMNQYGGETADLTLSLDVIYHLVEDAVFEHYMRTLFAASRKYVVVYASDSDDNGGNDSAHVRHRKFTPWIREHLPAWELIEHVPNRYPYRGDHKTGSFADFYIYGNSAGAQRQ